MLKKTQGCVVFTAILLSSRMAQSAQTSDMAPELQRFVKAYRVAEAADIGSRTELQIARKKGRTNGDLLECMYARSTPENRLAGLTAAT